MKRIGAGLQKGGKGMKQLIVLIAMIILGIAIAGFVVGLGDSASALATGGANKITTALGNSFGN